MKKFLLAMTAIAVVAFVGCKKENDEASDALSGTSWTYYDSGSWGWERETISFHTGGKATMTWAWDMPNYDDSGSESVEGTYTYNEPNVVITIPSDEGKGDMVSRGTVYDTYMVLDGDTYYKN